jgi:hypothetical protein
MKLLKLIPKISDIINPYALLLALLLPLTSLAQLLDPSRGCFYTTDPNNCQRPTPPPAQQQPSTQPYGAGPYGLPLNSGGSCPAACRSEQNRCTSACQRDPDFYSCFSRCGEEHTLCVHNRCGM